MSDKEEKVEDLFEEAEDDFDADEASADNEILGAFSDDEESEGGAEEGEEKEAGEGGEEGQGEEPAGDEEETAEKEGDKDALQGEKEGEEGEKEVETEVEIEEDGAWKIPDSAQIRLKVDEEEVLMPIGEVIASAQKATSATKKWQEAAAFQKRSLEVIDQLKEDPLATAYHLLVEDIGEEKAYALVLDNATQLVGRELEFQKLPESEREKRKSETAIAARDREIARLRQEKETDAHTAQGRMLANQIIAAAVESGIGKSPEDALENHSLELKEIASIFDNASARGKPMTAAQAVKEYHKSSTIRLDERIRALPADELERILKRAKPEASRKVGIRRVRRGASTQKVNKKPKPRSGRKRPKIYATFEEARRDA